MHVFSSCVQSTMADLLAGRYDAWPPLTTEYVPLSEKSVTSYVVLRMDFVMLVWCYKNTAWFCALYWRQLLPVVINILLCFRPHRVEALSDAFVWRLLVCLTSVCRVLTREQRSRKTKIIIVTEVAHVTRDSDNTFKVKRSKINFLLMS